jgi:hypothetical protein
MLQWLQWKKEHQQRKRRHQLHQLWDGAEEKISRRIWRYLARRRSLHQESERVVVA